MSSYSMSAYSMSLFICPVKNGIALRGQKGHDLIGLLQKFNLNFSRKKKLQKKNLKKS